MTKKQSDLFSLSKTLVPGGVHSPVRSFKGLHTTPRFFERAKGAYIYDVDQKEYIDFCMSFGPLILGHRHPKVEAALHAGLERGWSYGACEPYSLELAQFLLSKLPHVEQLRFVNSGTEAVMTALRLARGVTGKNKIIKFSQKTKNLEKKIFFTNKKTKETAKQKEYAVNGADGKSRHDEP